MDEGDKGKRWVVNRISRGGKSVCIAASWVGSHEPRLGLPRKSSCRNKDIRGEAAKHLRCVSGWKGHVWEIPGGKCLRDPENRWTRVS